MEKNIVTMLIKKGVTIPNPESVYVSETVNPDRISGDNVTIYAGCKIFGKKSLIMKNTSIGYESPVTLENTFVGENVQLNGGFFKGTVFAGGNVFGSGAHVREGTILEEQANAAHTVGLKQTILFPFVTLGSLINFCDCFMAGGTSRKDHSEVGSSFIHFNYTPNQDKATPSMLGDVHQGVMINQKPIFLGGQGGLVGPVRVAYGCISAAGSIIRKNELRPDRLLLGGGFKNASLPRALNVYSNITHIYNNNIYYIAGLISLQQWYRYVRPLFMSEGLSVFLHQGMLDNLEICIRERIKRLIDFGEKLKTSKKTLLSQGKENISKTVVLHEDVTLNIQRAAKIFNEKLMQDTLNGEGKKFLRLVEEKKMQTKDEYITVIQGLSENEKRQGTQWLYAIEQNMVEQLIIGQEY